MQTYHAESKAVSRNLGAAKEFNVADVLADRFLNVAKDIADSIRAKRDPEFQHLLTLADKQFVIDTLMVVMADGFLDEITPEKKKLLKIAKSKAKFLDHVKKHGGVLSSAEVAEVLDVSKVTIKNKKDSGKLFAMKDGSEFVFPAFQFTTDDSCGHGGVVRGLEEILSCLKDTSNVRKFGFFTKPQSVFYRELPEGEHVTIISMLRKGVSNEELQEIVRLAQLYGTQDAQ